MLQDSQNIRARRAGAFIASLALAWIWAAPASAQQAQPPQQAAIPSPSLTQPGAAKSAAPGDRAETAAPAEPVPPEVLQAITRNDAKARAIVRKYLIGQHMEAQAVTNRSLALVRAVRESGAGQDPQRFLEISTRISEIAKQIFENASITRVVVDKSYHPDPGAKAWKFGPADAETPAGFEKVTPDDPRLRGVDMRGVNRPGSDPLTSSGIVGVRNFNSALRNGEWRVILLTDDTGNPNTSVAPFGQSVRINSTQVNLLEADPSEWLDKAYLTNRNIKAAPTSNPDGAPDLGVKDGVVTHQSTPPGGAGGLPQDQVASSSAGALMLSTKVNDSQLNVGFVPPQNRPDQNTFVIGLIAEPATQPPTLQQRVTTLDIEGKIFTQAVQLTEPPKAGQPITAPQPGQPQQTQQQLDVVTPSGTSTASPT